MKSQSRVSILESSPRRPRGRPKKNMGKHPVIPDVYLPARKNSFGQYQRVWVIFTNESRIPWLHWLRPGFRHCFALLNDGQHWLAIEPLASCMEVTVLPPAADFNLPEWLRGQGHHAVEAELSRDIWRMAPISIFNCVEVVKRLLGIRRFGIFTPYQLYRHLHRKLMAAQSNTNPNQN